MKKTPLTDFDRYCSYHGIMGDDANELADIIESIIVYYVQRKLEGDNGFSIYRDARIGAFDELINDVSGVFLLDEPPKKHDSDCAVHNEPALPKGECNCSLKEPS